MSVNIQTAKPLIDEVLTDFFALNYEKANGISAEYGQLWASIRRLSQAGGKRLRPYMTMLAYEVFGGEYQTVITPAAAWELLHLCMLIHDDVIDNDLTRYGVANIAGEYEQLYAPLNGATPRKSHLAASAAILAGDVMLSSAHQLILDAPLSADQKITAMEYITAATFAVAGGELMDTESVLRPFDNADTLTVAKYKTASYSFAGPLGMGAALAGATKNQLALLAAFAENLGIAYQLIDDNLGVFGNPDTTGKSNSSDIREGKRTLLMQQTFALASSYDQQTLQALIGKQTITAPEVTNVTDIITRSGARQVVQQRIDDYISNCHGVLTELSQQIPSAMELAALTDLAIKRQS